MTHRDLRGAQLDRANELLEQANRHLADSDRLAAEAAELNTSLDAVETHTKALQAEHRALIDRAQAIGRKLDVALTEFSAANQRFKDKVREATDARTAAQACLAQVDQIVKQKDNG